MSTANFNSISNVKSNSEQKQTSTFFNTSSGAKDNVLGACSVTDSAYDSLVCSPFSPIIDSSSDKLNPSDYPENFSNTLDSISPFPEVSEADDVFKVSLEQINTERKPIFSTSNTIFRPIPQREINDNSMKNREDFYSYSSSSKSHRSISTQTKFSLSSIGFYRPNSAPLQEGIEEELSEITTSAIESSNYQIPRNSTCHCIRSPMPDLIQPTLERDNQLLVSRLSLIADQIDRDMSPASQVAPRPSKRTRRFSTPSMTELTPGGSFLDLLISIYQAFDKKESRRRSATYSHNETEDYQ